MIILLLIPLMIVYVIIGIVFVVSSHKAKKMKPWEKETQELLKELLP